MKKKIVIGINNDVAGCINLLKSDFIFNSEPHIFVEGNNYSTNFDCLLNYDVALHPNLIEICNALKIPVIGTRRKSKSVQSVLLKANGILTPETYFKEPGFNVNISENIESLLRDVDDSTQILIKPTNGACGVGIRTLTRSDIKHAVFSDDSNEVLSEKEIALKSDFDEQKELNKREKREGYDYFRVCFNSGDFIIQKYITEIQEYRLVYFRNGTMYLLKRIKKRGNVASNLSIKGNSTLLVNKTELADIVKTKDFNNIAKFIHSLNTPFLSVDLFITPDKRIGVFEYQMEFGYEQMPIKGIIKNMTDSINLMIKQKS